MISHILFGTTLIYIETTVGGRFGCNNLVFCLICLLTLLQKVILNINTCFNLIFSVTPPVEHMAKVNYTRD